eukprot:scaffold32648_cov166-Skeletonema_menzelii.AAC.4
MNTDTCSSATGLDSSPSATIYLPHVSSEGDARMPSSNSSRTPLRSSLRLQKNTDAESSRRSVTFGLSDRSLNSFASSLDPDVDLDQGQGSFNTRDDNGILLDDDEHINDRNDSEANLSFKEFRRSLDILKKSLIQADFDPNDLDLDSTGSYDESDEDEDEYEYDRGGGECLDSFAQNSVDDSDRDRPSIYAQGTSSRSMKGFGRKSKLHLNCNNRAKLNWLKSFYRLDPRWQICNFFDDLAHEGVERIDESGRIQLSSLPFIMRAFSRVGVFSVWRPTSNEAIRRMITGEGTGKGMDIKGKSAIRGKYSGFVPFLQIHRNEDKLKVGSLHAHARVRVFYPNKLSRDRAFMSMAMAREKMVETTQRSMRLIAEIQGKEVQILNEEMHKSMKNISQTSMRIAIGSARERLKSGPDAIDQARFVAALEAEHNNSMLDADVYKIDDYASTQGCYGLDIPEKLFWKTFVSKADISREDGSEYDTGRASMPEFQVMNLESLRKAPKSGPRPVLWHAGCGKIGEDPPQHVNPLSPFDLLMAYEETDDRDVDAGKVTPVVSDFDCFLVGTRWVEYRDHLGEQELSMLKWCVDEIEGVLDNTEKGKSWTRHWLDVKKKYAFDPRFQVPVPKMGYADPRSKAMLKGAVYSLRQNGAVRHGPECFNYSFPQQLDDKFLVISDTLPGLVPWKYVDIKELKEILAEKIDDGFAFPLNPKWILCDEGWKGLYDKLLASEKPNVQDAMDVWYPADVRERIAAISSKHPNGFNSKEEEVKAGPIKRLIISNDLEQHELEMFKSRIDIEDFTSATAELELERYKKARSGKVKFRKALLKKKAREGNIFSAALMMIEVGKEADQAHRPRMKESGSKK